MRLFFRWRPSFRFPMRFMYSGYSSIMQWRQSFESVTENFENKKIRKRILLNDDIFDYNYAKLLKN